MNRFKADTNAHFGLRNPYAMLLITAAVVVAMDQITKFLVLQYMPLYQSIPVIPGLFNLTHIHNPGGAFGILADASSLVRKLVFLCISGVAVVVVFYFYKTTPPSHRWLAFSFSLIFGGAIGNLIDRIRFGKVVDFLDLYIGNLHWPAFNVADSAVTIGIIIFAGHILLDKMPEPPPDPNTD